MTSKHHNRRPDIMHESRLTLPRVKRYLHVLTPIGLMEMPVGYARKRFISTGENRGKPFPAKPD